MKKPPDAPKEPFEVGYGKPPKHTRFQPGQSGNPKGRTAGSLNLATVFNKALKDKVLVTENGRRKQITKLEAAVKGMINRAVKGDTRAVQQMLVLAPLMGLESAIGKAAIDANDAAVMKMILERFSGESADDAPTDAS